MEKTIRNLSINFSLVKGLSLGLGLILFFTDLARLFSTGRTEYGMAVRRIAPIHRLRIGCINCPRNDGANLQLTDLCFLSYVALYSGNRAVSIDSFFLSSGVCLLVTCLAGFFCD